MALYGKDIDKHIVTSGDLAMVAGGQDLYSYTGSTKRRKIHITRPGQLVAYTKSVGSVPQTVDVNNLDADKAKSLFWAVGVDTTGNGLTDQLKHLGREDLSTCALEEVSASSPKCGSPAVQDLYFTINGPGTYAIRIDVESQKTRDFSPIFKGHEEFVASYTVTEEQFNAPGFDSDVVACSLAKQLRNEYDYLIKGQRYPDFLGQDLERAFSATRLHAKSLVYCFSPTELSGSCENCTHLGAILKATINGSDVTLVGNTDPADTTKTLRGQLESIADQINAAFQDAYGDYSQVGVAYVTGSFADCCPLELHVNTCDTNFALLTTGDATITPKVNVNPFTEYGTFTNVQECIDCGDAPTQRSYTTGIRIIGERFSQTCGSLINKPLAHYGLDVDIVLASHDWRDASWDKVNVQKMELPGGFGSQIQWYEYQQDVGGEGRNYNRSNNLRGWIGQPEDGARAVKGVTADCGKDYCSYFMRFQSPRRAVIDAGAARDLQINSHIHVPATDAVTRASVEAFIAELSTLNIGCKIIGSATCNPSQVVETIVIE